MKKSEEGVAQTSCFWKSAAFLQELTDKPQSFQRRETLRYRLFVLFVLFVRHPLALVAFSSFACNEKRERRLDVVSTREIPLVDGQAEVPARVDVE
jgi:hypothetical protein